jgi:hypothetical protein
MLLVSAVRAPVPGVNEPHYLTKAKHYWDPAFCANDFFLESSNAHLVFYQTIGLLTKVCSLEQTAWIGRVLALALLAVGWTQLASRLLPGNWSALWACWVYLALAAVGNASHAWTVPLSVFGIDHVPLQIVDLSGEWIVGGIEAKVVAYGLIFLSLARWLSDSPIRAAAYMGAAVSFHPVVGIWSAASVLFAVMIGFLLRRTTENNIQPEPAQAANPTLRSMLICGTAFVACALPGLLPSLSLLSAESRQIARNADYIQVYYRLRHHLDPMTFPASAWISFGLLALFGIAASRFALQQPARRRYVLFVVGSLVVLAAGTVIGFRQVDPEQALWWSWRAKLLKFYPFRLADAFVPITVALVVVGLAGRLLHRLSNRRAGGFGFLLFAPALLTAVLIPQPSRNPSGLGERELADWRAACEWIRTNTPQEALFHTPQGSWAFKWHAGRAEYVSFKDCPQDAAGIVEWNRRLLRMKNWAQTNYSDEQGYSVEAATKLRFGEDPGITHILADRLGPFDLEPIYRNETYTIYRIPALDE